MSPGDDRVSPGVIARMILGLARWLVPGPARAEWQREWRAELDVWTTDGRPVSRAALGSLPHAMVLRWGTWMAVLDQLSQDARFAVRSLGRRPLFALTAVLTLALGLGATTAVYSVVDGVLLAPLPYPGGKRLIRVTTAFPPAHLTGLGFTFGLLDAWRTRARVFEAMEGYTLRDTDLVGEGTPAVVQRARVTSNLLAGVFGLSPRIGRLFRAAEFEPGAGDVVLLSEELWRSRYGGDPSVLGRVLRLDDTPYVVVGVVPSVAVLPSVDVWIPLAEDGQLSGPGVSLGAITVLARRRPGVDMGAALADLQQAARRAAPSLPRGYRPFLPEVQDYRAGLVTDVRANLLILLGAVVVVLVIACVNVANLLLVRAGERVREMALRSGLGASRGQILRQLLIEGTLLAGLGGIAGLAVAFVALRGLLSLVPTDIPLAGVVVLNGRVLLASAGLTLGTGVLFSLIPALRGSVPTAGLLGTRHASANRRRSRTRAVLLGLEVAQAGLLLVAAILLLQSLQRMNAADPGFDPDGLIYAHVDLPDWAFGPSAGPAMDLESRRAFLAKLEPALRSLPQVRSVGIASATPFSGMTFMTGMEQEGGRRPNVGDGGLDVAYPENEDLVWFSQIRATDGYLDALRLPVVRGRSLSAADVRASRNVVVVNETAATAYWPGENPVGQRIRQASDEAPWATVVGVVRDFHHPGLPTAGVAEVYWPFTSLDQGWNVADLAIRHQGDAASVMADVRQAIWSLDPRLPIPQIATARETLSASLAGPRFYAVLLGVFALAAVLLSCVGIYGVTAHAVSTRKREMGVRIALGAASGQVRWQVVREGMRVVVPGLFLGLGTATLAARLLESLLYGVTTTDPAAYAATAVLLLAVAAAATWIPATRATRADPVASLRAE